MRFIETLTNESIKNNRVDLLIVSDTSKEQKKYLYKILELNGKLAFGIGNPDVTIQSTTSINTGTWYHVAATWNGTTGEMKLYINGVLESTGSGATGTRTTRVNNH